MSATEIIVILFGLYVGYWVVSKLLTGGPATPAQTNSEQTPQPEASKDPGNASQAWHEILKVAPDATVDEIRQSYRTLMHQYHPDKVASLGEELKALAERKSKEINSAYAYAMQMHGVSG